MKIVVAALLFALPARAQFGTGFPPVASIRIQNSGVTLATRPYLNCIGQTTCAVQSNSAISISVAAGAGGTLQTAYNNSAGASPSILLTAANAAVDIRGPAVAMGTLFQVETNTPTAMLTVTDNGTNVLDSTAALNLGHTSATSMNYGNGTIQHIVSGGGVELAQAVQSAAVPMRAFWVNANAVSGIAAGTEYSPVVVDLNNVRTWNTGALATERFFAIYHPTIAFSGASTVTTAATLAIENAPAAGANATITNAYALWVQGGMTELDGGLTATAGAVSLTGNGASSFTTSAGALTLDSAAALNLGTSKATAINYGNGTITHAFTGSITDNTVAGTFTHSAADNYGATPTAYLTLENTTAAALNAQQFSPFVTLQGRGWETTGGTSQTVGWQMGVRPVQGTTIFPDLVFYEKESTAGAYTEMFRFNSVNGANPTIFTNSTQARFFNNGTSGIEINNVNDRLWIAGVVDLTVTASSVTAAANVSFSGTAGTGGLTLGSMTGASTMPTGNWSWTGASTKTFAATSTGAAGTISLTSGDALNFSYGANSTWSATTAAAAATGFSLTQTGSAGGAATAGSNGGVGGFISTTAGTGGADSAAYNGGNGGALTEQAGTGGAAATNAAGAGGIASLIGGTGGANTAAGGGAGGAVNITGGTGGASALFTGANGGAVNISGGTSTGNGSTGAINLQTNTVLAANVNISTTAGTTAVDWSNGSGVFKTTTGVSTFRGSSNNFTNTITLSANAGISGTAGTGALALGVLTGDSNFPTGQFNWAGAATKTASLVGASTFTITAGAASTWSTSSGALTLTSAAAATWSTGAGALTVQGSGGVNLNAGPSTVVDVGVSSSTAVTLANAQSVNMNAAAQGSHVLVVASAPTIAAGFGTGAAVSKHNGTAAFRIGVGVSSATTGTIGLPTATNGWNCYCTDITTADATREVCKQITTASPTTQAIIGNFTDLGAAAAWADNDVIAVSCFAF